MRGVKLFVHENEDRDGKDVEVATIRRRRRAVTDTDALAIRDHKMLEMHVVDDFSTQALAKIWGLSERSIQAGIRRAKTRALGQAASRASRVSSHDPRQARKRSGAP